jgi:5'-nucleotidase/UDP-sugar diphosphatase
MPVLSRLSNLRETLAGPVGLLDERFVSRTPTRHELLSRVAERALALTGADAMMINETCLRPTGLGTVLRTGDLMTLEPFGNALACIRTADPHAMAQHLAECSGPLVCVPQLPRVRGRPVTVVTTDYLAGTYLDGYQRVSYPTPDVRPQLVRDVLLEVLLAADDYRR